ncbi:hypothetical protein ACNKH9_15595 [Metapseudomonas otitidis]|uniref:hypothetical protein n=1 Tax=Metapseudomonas otitidis TaxID=319939 RepID=UPI003A8BACB2
MNQSHRYLTDAELAIAQQLGAFQEKAAKMWRGHEKEAVIALIRALDFSAVIRLQEVDAREGDATEGQFTHRIMSLGAAAALRPFLPKIGGQPSGVPWGPMRPDVAQFAYSYLRCCGQLTHLSRMAALERQGLATTSFVSANHILIQIPNSASEFSLQHAIRATSSHALSDTSAGDMGESGWKRLRKRMKSYVDAPDGWFIRYDNDQEIVSTYLARARHYGSCYLEAEALPEDIKIADRTFGEWVYACDQALGRILCHIDFVGLLQEKRPKVDASNVLTLFARRHDIDDVWQEAGLPVDRVPPTMQALTLESGNLDDWEKAHEVPCALYVDLGKEHVLLPCFGTLTNPYLALFRHLRSTYKPDWDRGVDRREAIFRSDLPKAFPGPDFLVPSHGFQLRRTDGSKLTDVDAIVLDRRHGTLVLVQLKWHDVFGFSLPERESRRRNISKANEWTERVISWIDGRTSAQLARALGLDAKASDRPPLLYVVARYAARFTGEAGQDPRASWLGWPEILHVLHNNPGGDILSRIPQLVLDHQARFTLQEEQRFEFRFPGLSADLLILPDC